MEITTELIKSLRDETGVSVMQCKKALEEAEGDKEKALLILKKKSSEVAAKKSDREAHAGILTIKKTNDRAIIVELNCETDFVAKNADFIALAEAIGEKGLNEGKDALTSSAKEMIDPVIQKVGENIVLGEVVEVTGSPLGAYVHDGHIATVVALSGGDEQMAKDLAMHIAAMNPEFTDSSEIPQETLNTITELCKKEVEESDKPEEIKAKILEGKISGYLKERTLMDQSFFKDPSKTIKQFLGSATLQKFVRLSIG